MAEEIELEKCSFRNFTDAVTLTLTLNRVVRHTIMHHSSTSMYTPNFIEIGQTLWTDVPTDGRTFPPSNVWRSRPKKQATQEQNSLSYNRKTCKVLNLNKQQKPNLNLKSTAHVCAYRCIQLLQRKTVLIITLLFAWQMWQSMYRYACCIRRMGDRV